MEAGIILRTGRRTTRGARALFRYQGGKQKLCGSIVDIFPRGIKRYIEPFIGAGSVYLELRNRGFSGPAFLGDWNPEIANVHHVVATAPDGFEGAYCTHYERHSREYFYHLRDQDTAGWTDVTRAARIVYLAKAAFHGLLRVNGAGRIVSTYGTGELKRMELNRERIRKVSEAFRGADIRCDDFGWIEAMAQAGDLVFMDSPYVGGNVCYVAEGFSVNDHLRLQQVCRTLDTRGVIIVLTNADRPYVRDLYSGFHLIPIPPAPSIGCGGSRCQPVGELIITNFEPRLNGNGKFQVAA
jgi:DNA adenine methylase